jgi:hypothetical protein
MVAIPQPRHLTSYQTSETALDDWSRGGELRRLGRQPHLGQSGSLSVQVFICGWSP